MTTSDVSEPLEGIAIVGMAGRFPGATNLDDFWANLKNGVESVRFFTDEELKNAGISDHVMSDPSYVKARGALNDIEGFDAGLFGFTPREAEIADQVKYRLEEDRKLEEEKRMEDESKAAANMRLAYQDISLQQKKKVRKLIKRLAALLHI